MKVARTEVLSAQCNGQLRQHLACWDVAPACRRRTAAILAKRLAKLCPCWHLSLCACRKITRLSSDRVGLMWRPQPNARTSDKQKHSLPTFYSPREATVGTTQQSCPNRALYNGTADKGARWSSNSENQTLSQIPSCRSRNCFVTLRVIKGRWRG